MPYVSFWKEKSHSVTFPVCAYMLHDNLAKFLWNLELKTKLLLHGYKYEENKFCHVLLFKKIVAEWEEFFGKCCWISCINVRAGLIKIRQEVTASFPNLGISVHPVLFTFFLMVCRADCCLCFVLLNIPAFSCGCLLRNTGRFLFKTASEYQFKSITLVSLKSLSQEVALVSNFF